jgi:hypothetical protein
MGHQSPVRVTRPRCNKIKPQLLHHARGSVLNMVLGHCNFFLLQKILISQRRPAALFLAINTLQAQSQPPLAVHFVWMELFPLRIFICRVCQTRRSDYFVWYASSPSASQDRVMFFFCWHILIFFVLYGKTSSAMNGAAISRE